MPVNLIVKPDNQAESGYTLNQLMAYLQWSETNYANLHRAQFGNWESELGSDRLARTGGIYISVPITINLLEGVYVLDNFVRIYTISDLQISGQGKETLIQFKKFDFEANPICNPGSYSRGKDRLIVFGSPWKSETSIKYERTNRLTMQNFSLRLEEALWYPYKRPMVPHNGIEVTLGVVISYANFHNAEINGLDIKVKDNGEFTILDGDECDHQTVTGCDLYLNNWNDRTSGQWERCREQGDIFNVRGNNESVLISGNSFTKHGNDEALCFLKNGLDEIPKSYTHENISVIQNTFTYLDAEVKDIELPVDPDLPPVNPGLPDTPVVSSPTENLSDNPQNNKRTANSLREVHVIDRLIGFGDDSKVRVTWRNVLFADNTLYLQGPVRIAVGMSIFPGDTYQNVVFANNTLYHSYRHNGRRPGNSAVDSVFNGADTYWRSSSFTFEIRNIIKSPEDDTSSDSTSAYADGSGSNSVSYYGNSIFYSQHTEDNQVNPSYKLAYNHACFKIYGGCVDIHDNYIDGTKAVVRRLEGAYGIYGNPDNPISLLHCRPCEIEGSHTVRMYNNQAIGYGSVVRCRDLVDPSKEIKNHTIRLTGNTFCSGAACVINNLTESTLDIIQNRFFNCSRNFMFCGEGNMKDVRMNISQNMFDSDRTDCNYSGNFFNLDDSPERICDLTQLFVMSNCMAGYTENSLNVDSDLLDGCQYYSSGNVFALKSTNPANPAICLS